jgi:hypothetical protein
VTERVDLHQHLWPEGLIALLARRRTPPYLFRRGTEWTLRLHGEPDCAVDLADHEPARRAALAERDGVERVVVCLSTPLGIEGLPDEEAAPLLEAFHDGVRELGAPFGLWAAAPREDAAGISIPAAALVDGTAAFLLAWAQARDVPVLVHPGPAAAPADAPPWWPALTDYVAQMHAAWLAFETRERPRHPGLRIVFAMLAGLAPLHAERLAARGAAIAHDPRTFYDVSSYGLRAVDAMIRAVCIDQLVLGSDRPVVAPPELGWLGEAATAAIATANPARVLAAA